MNLARMHCIFRKVSIYRANFIRTSKNFSGNRQFELTVVLDQSFFEKPSTQLARDLLGCELVRQTPDGVTSGIIVETEAYSQEDAASHSFKGETARTKVMFGPAGYAYVYFTYGMHYCFNVVSGNAGDGQAVLIRALEPVEGIDLMKQRRGRDIERELCNGPAKLVQAMGITRADYGKPLFGNNELFINTKKRPEIDIVESKRIGITKDTHRMWRYHIKDSPFTSK
jgi:DNA-3-methyladenine glycosylase